MKHLTNQNGFTLIESVVAIAILTIGILTLYTMQVSAINGNATASRLTIASTWASDRVERLMALDYDDTALTDQQTTGNPGYDSAGLNEKTVATADGNDTSPDGQYTIFWNVADFLTPDPSSPTASTVKAVRIIVLRQDRSMQKEVVVNYYKQKNF
jgi:type IV pilus modification protein PilV